MLLLCKYSQSGTDQKLAQEVQVAEQPSRNFEVPIHDNKHILCNEAFF